MHLTINWIISKANLVYITFFHLNLSSFSVNFTFRIVVKFNFILISVFNHFVIRIVLLKSNLDYSANSYPNHSIFYSVDSKLSYLS